METITWEDYQKNDEMSFYSHTRESTNIKCPKCGNLIYRNVQMVLTTYPVQYRYECDACGWFGVGR